MTVLVVLGIYPDIGFLGEIEKRIDSIYPEEIEWVRGDELILAVKDSAENLSISIEKPREGYIYIFDREICKIPSEKAIIIGKITVKAKAYGNISKVEFYIDDKLKSTDNEYPYEWLWSEKTFFKS